MTSDRTPEDKALQKENDVLRALLGNSAKPCPYCGLAAEDQGKCAHGFPGCARADDQMLSKHFAAGWKAEEQTKRIAELEAKIAILQRALVEYNDRLRSTASISSRHGAGTNWLAFDAIVKRTLVQFHALANVARAAQKQNDAIEKLTVELAHEREKVVCKECGRRGRTIEYGPSHCANTQCYKCHGKRKNITMSTDPVIADAPPTPSHDYETTQLIYDMVQEWGNRGEKTSLYEWDTRCKAVILRMRQWLDTTRYHSRDAEVAAMRKENDKL